MTLRRWIGLVIGLGVVGLVVLALRPSPVPVDMALVQGGALRVTVDAEGKTRIRQRFVISSPVAGRLARLDLKAGDLVARDMLLAQIDPLPKDAAVREAQGRLAEWRAQRAGVATLRPKQDALVQLQARIAAAQAAQRSAEARVEQARAALVQAQREQQRAERLEAAGTIARETRETAQLTATTRSTEVESAVLAAQEAAAEVRAAQAALAVLKAQQHDPDYLLDVYEARIASAEAELARLRDEAARTEIRAPVSGRVLRLLQENERVVAAGTPLLEIGNPGDLELVVDVLSTDAVRIQPGAKMLIEHWGGGQTLEARVRLVEPAAFTKISALGVEEQRVNIIGDFVASDVPLGDGYRVEARIVVWESSAVLHVPLSAIFRCDDDWCVFVVSADKAQRRQIEIGHRSDVAVEVRQGLAAGDTVILYPSERIEDGQRVEARAG